MVGTNIGVDLGTAYTSIYMEGKGIVLTEPTVIAYDSKNKIAGIGKKAYEMIGKNPEKFRVVRPVVKGTVADFTATKQVLEYYISVVCKNMVFRPNVIVSVHSSLTEFEKKTVLDVVNAAGAAKACLIDEPLAAALGIGLETNKPKGVMIVDIGAGTTDIAVITMGGIAEAKSINSAGDSLNEGIMRQLRRERDLIISEKTAEKIKVDIGAATLRDVELGMTVKGKSYITNMPVTFEVSSTEIFLAMRSELEAILEGIRSVLEVTTPELCADVLDNGIILTGGGANLRYMGKMMQRKLGIKVKVASDPANCVVTGTGRAINNMDILYHNGNMFKARTEEEQNELK